MRIREPLAKLCDYHCFSTLVSLHEPHSYCEPGSDPLWQQAMTDEIQVLEKTHT